MILPWNEENMCSTCFCTWKVAWPTCCLSSSSFSLHLEEKHVLGLNNPLHISYSGMTCVGIPVTLEILRNLLEIEGSVSWGSKEALLSKESLVALPVSPIIILDYSPSGLSFPPPYTEIMLHFFRTYLSDICLISCGILNEVQNKLEKNGWEKDNVSFKYLVWCKMAAAKNQDMQCKFLGTVGKTPNHLFRFIHTTINLTWKYCKLWWWKWYLASPL